MSEQTIEAPVQEAVTNERPWRAVLAPEGIASGDGRKFAPGSLTWRDLPLPLSWQKATALGHDGSVVVGHIDTITRNGNIVEATGFLNDSPEAAEVIPLLENKSVKGVSVDVDMLTSTFEDIEGNPIENDLGALLDFDGEIMQVASKGRIAGATICPIPAFMEATLELTDTGEYAVPPPPKKVAEAPPKGAAPPKKAPPPPPQKKAPPKKDEKPEDTQESLDAEAKALLASDLEGEDLEAAADALLERYEKAKATPPDALIKAAGLEPEKIIEAHLDADEEYAEDSISTKPWGDFSAADYDDEQWFKATIMHLNGDSRTKGDNKLPVREPSGTLNKNGIHAAASALAGGRGGVDAPAEAKKAAAKTIVGLYSKLKEDPPDSIKSLAGSAWIAHFETVSNEDWEGGAENFTPEQWQRSTLIHLPAGPGQDPDTKGLHKLPVRNPGGTLVRRAILSAASILAGARGGVKAPVDQKVTAAQEVVRLYREELGEDPPKSVVRLGGASEKGEPEESEGEKKEAAALEPVLLVASAAPVSGALFANPQFSADDGRMVLGDNGKWGCPLTIDGDHIFGHVAQWGVCHIAFDGSCVTPPPSETGYAYFRTGEADTTDGTVAVGTLTLGTGHAAAHLGHRPAVAHYDNTGMAVADVTCGEDEFGIWYSGRLRPGVTEDQKAEMRASGGISGDWRRIGGSLELVAGLVVNVPGFPVPRLSAASERGRQVALVASGVVLHPEAPNVRDLGPEEWGRRVALEIRRLNQRQTKAARLAAKIGRDRRSRAAAAAATLVGKV